LVVATFMENPSDASVLNLYYYISENTALKKVNLKSIETTIPAVDFSSANSVVRGDAARKYNVVLEKPALTFTKIANIGTNGTAEPGEIITYTILVTNDSNSSATEIEVTDNLVNVKNAEGDSILDIETARVTTTSGTVSLINGLVTVTGITIPAKGTATVVIEVKVLNPYPLSTVAGEKIVNVPTVSGKTPDCTIDSLDYNDEKCGPIVIPEAKSLLLRNDIFTERNVQSFNPASLPSVEVKNANPPVVRAGDDVFYFITLTNVNPFTIKIPNTKKAITSDYAMLKDNVGNQAFTAFSFEGIIFKNDKTDAIIFLDSTEVSQLVTFLNSNGFGTSSLLTNEFNFTTVLPNSSLTFVVKATLNPNGVFDSRSVGTTAGILENFVSLTEDDPKNFSDDNSRELRKTTLRAETIFENLTIEKLVDKDTVSVGEFVPYTIEITNKNSNSVNNVFIEDRIPAGFIFVQDSARAYFTSRGTILENGNGIPVSTSGLKTVKIGPLNIPSNAERMKVTYLLKVGVGVTTGTYKNIAVIKNDMNEIISNQDTAEVRVVPDALFDQTIIVGKVFHDKNENGIQEEGEEGISGVRVATVEGINAVTDRFGRYHIPEVTNERGQNYIIKVDPITLPEGSEFTTENPLVKRLGKTMLRYNFGVKLPEPKVIDRGKELVVTLEAHMFSKGTKTLKDLSGAIEAILVKIKSADPAYRKIIVICLPDYDGKSVSNKEAYFAAEDLAMDRAVDVAEVIDGKLSGKIPVETRQYIRK
ncbi:MAG: SdrD B-like domain-containing protein, partial [Fusobacteriaceae bacterium]